MKTLSSADRQTALLSAILWMLALLPIIPVWTWDLAAFRHLVDPTWPIPKPWAANDFLMIWSVGHLVFHHAAAMPYHVSLLNAFQSRHLPGNFMTSPWIYPPPTMMVTLLLGRVSLAAGLWLWIIALTLCSLGLLRAAGLPWLVIIGCLISPAALFAAGIGQFSVLAASLFTYTLLRADSAPKRAGLCSALTIIKPQMALLGPVILLARRRWRGLISGALAAIIILAVVTIILGYQVWPAYFRYGIAESRIIVDMPYPSIKSASILNNDYELYGSSVFWMLRSMHVNITLATVGQGIAASAAVAYGWGLWRQDALNRVTRVAITLLLGVLISPYGFAEDLAGYSMAIMLLIWQRRRLEIADSILLVWPSFLPFIAIALHLELTPAFVLWAVLRARRELAPVQ